MVLVPRGRGATEGTSRVGMGSPPTAPHPGGFAPSRAAGTVRSLGAPRPRVTAEKPRAGSGLWRWSRGSAGAGHCLSPHRPDVAGPPPPTGDRSLLPVYPEPFTRLLERERAPGWGRTTPVPAPRGRGGYPAPPRLPVAANRGRAGAPGAAAPLIFPPPRCILPQTPTLLFCKSPEIFMALRRAPLNEFLIKTLSGSQNTPPNPPHPAVEGGRRPGPPVPGGWRIRARPRGPFTGGGNDSPGMVFPGPAAGFGVPDVQPRPPPALPRPPGPGETGRTPAKPRLDGTGGGQPGQGVPPPPQPPREKYSLRGKCISGAH